MRNIDITEWLLNNQIDSDTEIVMNGKQTFLADVLEKHLKEQFAISDVVGQSVHLPNSHCTLNRNTCGKGSVCKYPHCHL